MRYFYFVLSVNGRIGTGKVARAIVANAKMTINIDPNATQAIDDAFDSKKNEINNASNLTDSEKTDLINQAAEIANAAKDAINMQLLMQLLLRQKTRELKILQMLMFQV